MKSILVGQKLKVFKGISDAVDKLNPLDFPVRIARNHSNTSLLNLARLKLNVIAAKE